MYIYISESFCCTLQVNTILQINYTSILKNKIYKGTEKWNKGNKCQNWKETIYSFLMSGEKVGFKLEKSG